MVCSCAKKVSEDGKESVQSSPVSRRKNSSPTVNIPKHYRTKSLSLNFENGEEEIERDHKRRGSSHDISHENHNDAEDKITRPKSNDIRSKRNQNSAQRRKLTRKNSHHTIEAQERRFPTSNSG